MQSQESIFFMTVPNLNPCFFTFTPIPLAACMCVLNLDKNTGCFAVQSLPFLQCNFISLTLYKTDTSQMMDTIWCQRHPSYMWSKLVVKSLCTIVPLFPLHMVHPLQHVIGYMYSVEKQWNNGTGSFDNHKLAQLLFYQ